MGNPSAWGLDAAVPAAFLGLVWPRLKSSTDKTLAIIAAVFAIATTPFLPAGLPIIGTAVIAVIAGLRVKK
jgi:predicted branched-subunit amino acid permease